MLNAKSWEGSSDMHDYIRISVIDSGQGIKQCQQNKLFKLFGSHKNTKKHINPDGIGLGLVICQLIVCQFFGVIGFTSKFRKGSTFFYTFQLESISAQELREVASKNKMCASKGKKVVRQEISPAKTEGSNLTIFNYKKDINMNSILQNWLKMAEFRHLRVLVVDDEEFCLSSMRVILYKMGIDINFQADYCMNGKEALD